MSVEEKIVELLSMHPEGLTIARISKELNIHRNTTSKYVFALVRSGILEQRRVGVASLCYLKKKKGFTIGRKSIAKLSLVFLALIIILIFLFHYTIPITGSASRVFNFTELNGYRLELEAEKQKFFSNELVKISGFLTFSNNPVENQSLFLTLISSDRIENQTVLTDSEGSFSSLLKLKEGNYTLIASSGELETSLNFEVIEAPFNLSLEKNCFKTNETVRIFVQGEAEKEFVLEIFGPIIENFTLKTNEEGSYTFERSFSIPGNYTARVLGSEASFEVFEEKPEVNLKIKANETYWLEENISLEIEGSAETEFSLDIEKDEAKILSFFGKTNSSGLSEISFQVFEEGNYTARLKYSSNETTAFFEVLRKNLTKAFEENVSVENVTENVSFLVVSVEQGKAEINKPVQWRKTIRVINPSDKDAEIDLPLELPENSFNLSLEEKETKRIFKLEEKRLKDKLKGKESKDYVLTYYTEAPVAKETIVNEYRKIVTISSSLHYENVLAYTNIEKAAKDAIKIYWLVNNEKIDITSNESFRVNLLDLDNDNLIERVEWLVPYLSEQTFEISIVILNPYTYLRDNEVWVVAFNTTGKADLKISSPNANWAEMLKDNKETFDEMEFLDIKCGNNSLKDKLLVVDEFNNTYNYSQLTEEDSLKVKQLLIKDYSCEETGYISNRMVKAGYAILRFDFGGIIAYAYDQSPCQVYINSLPYNITQNNTYYCLNTSSTNLAVTAIQFGNSSSWVIQNSTLDCLGFNIDGNKTLNTYGIYLEGSETKNNTIKNCNITDFYNGIYLNSSLNHTLENISATSNENIGIYIFKTNQTTIKYSQSSLSQDIGIFIESSTQVKVINVTINNNTLCTDWCFAGGMYVLDSIDIEIINVTSNYQDQGIMLDNTNNSKITGATINFNTECEGWCYESGIVLVDSYNNSIINSTSNYNSDTGISLYSSSNNTIINSIANNNSYYGIYLYSSSNNSIINSTSNYNSYYGILLRSSSNNSIINSTSNSNSGSGIYLYSSSNNNQIINSTANSNGIGIYLRSSSNNQIINSTLQENSNFDFYIYASLDSHCNNYLENIIGSGNRPIKYYNYSINLANEVLSELILCNADYSNITNITIDASPSKNNNMLYVHRTDNSNFTQINSSYNYYGIYLDYSSNNQIINSTSNYNSDTGISLDSSSNNTIINSTSNFNSWDGIYLESSSNNNQIINSTSNSNSICGISLFSSSNNTIINSTFNSNSGTGIYLYSSSNNNTIINSTSNSNFIGILLFFNSNNNQIINSTSNFNSWDGISLDSSSSNSIINSTFNSNSYCGIYLSSNSNNNQIINSTSYNNSYGIYLSSNSNNKITGGSIASNIYQDYYLSSAGSTNNFTSTNFTAPRKIYFEDSSSWFNYNNRTDIELWLKTNVSATATITRKLISWTQSLVQWNDSSSSTVTARYNITGLNPNKYYLVYNNSVLTYILQTDSSGNLPSFTIYLSSEHEIKVQEDTTPPTYSLNSTNSTIAGTAVSHNLYWQDNVNLSYAIFSFDNCTGSFQNISEMSLSGTSAWSNFTVVINSTVGCTIRWKVYANDTNNNWNASEIFSYTTTSATPCQVYINASSQLPYTITLNNTYYCLNSSSVNTTTNGILFASGVQNSTLDCLGFNIDGNKTSNTYGIYLTGSNTKNNTIKNCNITDFYYGIYLNNGPNNNSIINSTSYNNFQYGIFLLSSSNNNQIINSTFNSNNYGIYLSSSSYNSIINSTSYNNSYGIYLDSSSNNNQIINSTSNSNNYGIYLLSSSYNSIINSTFNSNNYGIYLSSSSYNSIINSTSYNNSRGIYLFSSSNNTIINSTLQENSLDFYIYASSDSQCNNYLENIIGSNNLPIKYYNYSVNLANEVLSELILCNADKSNITNITIDASPSLNNNMLAVIRTDNSNFTQINSSYNYFGILLDSSSNNQIINSTANSNSVGIYLYSSSNNRITGGSIASNTNQDYYLRNASSTNNFTSTNFTAPRTIYFYDTTSWFNYNNRTDIELWLKTNVSAAYITLTRNIFSWSKPIIKWQENSSSSITAYYNLTGLYPNSLYKIYNGSQLTYTLQTDSSGNLNFNLTINSTSRNITVQYQNCEESIYSLPYTITKNNTYYCLESNFYIAGQTAITFASPIQNSTLDCLGFNLDGSDAYNTYGIYLEGSNTKNNTIKNCNITDFYYGIYLYNGPNNNSILNSTSNSNSLSGIYLYSSSNNQIINSTLQENLFDFYIYASSNSQCNNYLENIIGSGNRPIKYFNSSVNLANEVLSELILCNADNSNITNITIDASPSKNNNMLYVILTDNSSFTSINSSYNHYGIYFYSSSNNTIINSTSNSNSLYGIFLSSSSNNNTIINSTFNSNSEGIFLSSSSNNSIINSTSNSNSYGIYLLSTSNNQIINSIINSNSEGLKICFSSNNNITNSIFFNNSYGIAIGKDCGGTPISNNNFIINSSVFLSKTYDYYLAAETTGNPQNFFINTNFTAPRTIYFKDSSSWFNYNNRTDIELWLKTSVSSSSTLTRNIFSWSKPIIKWQENSSSSITAYYNLTGLYPNSLYKIYNGSQLTYTLQTDSSGNLNFNLTINSTSRNITVQYQNCEESIYSLPYNINKNNTYYCLESNFYIAGQTAITFANPIQNSTLDCLGYNIDSNKTSNTYGIYLEGSNTKNNTIKNCIITDFYYGIYLNQTNNNTIINSTSNNNSIGIRLYYSSNNTIINSTSNSNSDTGIYLRSSSYNSIINSTSNLNSWIGIYLYSSSNNNQIINSTSNSNSNFGIFLLSSSNNNQIINSTSNNNSIGIYLDSSSNNQITGGSIASNTNQDYYLSSAGSTNNFTSTNFTAPRKIYFEDTTSWFNYNNRTDLELWLKTSVSTSATITRKLISWTQSLVQWNDSSSPAVTARYNITGLNPNKYYLVYNNSVLTYILQTDSSGNLPSFTIYLSSEHEIKVQEDTTPPTYSLNSTNSTIAGTAVSHNLYWQDNAGLSYAIFSFDNCTGSFQNISEMSLSGTSAWSNFTVVINSTVGCTIRWKVYANDTSNNWNESEIFSYTTSATPCQVYINSLPYNITQNNTYYCLNTSSTNLAGTAIQFGNSSSWVIQNSTLDCQGFNIDGNKTSNTYGIYLTGSNTKNNTIKNCNITDFYYGIYLYNGPNNNTIINSTSNSNYYGIYLNSSFNNTIINSTLQENSFFDFYIYASSDSDCNNYLENIIGSNNLPIKYYNYSVNLANEVLSELILCNADYSNITNITIDASPSKKNNMLYVHRTDNSNFTLINSSYNYYGIRLDSSSYNSIVNSTFNSNSYGIYLYSSSNNSIINSTSNYNSNNGISLESSSNNQIINSTSNYNSGTGIILYSSYNNNIIINSTFNYNSQYGIYLYSSSNNQIINSTSNSNSKYGIYLYSSSNNRITGGSIASNTNQDYYLRNASSTNNFTSTNFTAPRTIYFEDTTSWFNYNNRTDLELWLKTSVSVAYIITLTRNIFSWSKPIIKWQENSSSSITAYYNLTGLYPNSLYKIYNGSQLTYTLQTDSSGNLNFNLTINSTSRNITVQYQQCEEPIYSLPYTITKNNTYYCLESDLYIAGQTAITFANPIQNSTLDCQGFNIDGNDAFNTYGIYLEGSETKNNTIKNCIITDFYYGIYLYNGPNNNTIINSTSNSNSIGIFLDSSSNNNTIINSTSNSNSNYGIVLSSSSNNQIINSIANYNSNSGISLSYSSNNNQIINSTSNSNSNYGIYLYSSSNNSIINSTSNSNSYGIRLSSSSSNKITGGSIASNTNQDYYLISAGSTNNFTSTNFTAPRTIYFYDSSSWFNYNNRTDLELWLKTNVSTSATITRKLISWTQSLIQWNDTNSSGTEITARYNITGLNPNKYYLVYNNSVLTYTLQADSSGNLPSFTIYLSGEKEIKVKQEEAPQWSNNKTSPSSPTVYQPTKSYQFNITCTDDTGIFNAWLTLNGTNYYMSNQSSEFYITLNDLPAGNYFFNFTCNDTYGITNTTDTWLYTIEKAKPILTISNSSFSINTSGLVGYWRLEEGSGSTAKDSSGYGNDGILYNNPIWTEGMFGFALSFNGSNYVEIPNSSVFNITEEMSVEAWFYAEQNQPTGSNQIVQRLDWSNYKGFFLREGYQSNHEVAFYVANGTHWVSVSYSVSPEKWYHVIGSVKSNDKIKLYVNGSLVAEYPFVGNIVQETNKNIRIGYEFSGAAFNGTIDEVKIWNRSLTQDEIEMLYQSEVTYKTQTNFSCSANTNQVSVNLYRNTTSVSNPDVQNLTAGYYYYLCNASETQNFTQSALLAPLKVNPGTISLTISPELTKGIFYTNLTGSLLNVQYNVEVNKWNNATWNYNASSQKTEYWIKNDGTFPIDICQKANSNMVCQDPWCGSYEIYIGNVSWSNSTLNDASNPSFSTLYPLTLDYSGNKSAYNLEPGSTIYLRFWFFVPSYVPSGKYNTSIVFKAVEAGNPC